MATLRAWRRATALILWTAAIFVAWALGLPLRLFSTARLTHWRRALLGAWARGAGRILGAELVSVGRPPSGPFLLVANHLSYVDVVLVASQLRCAFVAKAEVRDWPVVGWMVQAMNTIFLDREKARSIPAALDRIDELYDAGCGIVIFPEGTSSQGATVQPFHSPLLARAARRETPVHYAALSYEAAPGEGPAHLTVCWWGDMTLPRHLWHLLSMKGFRATVTFGNEPICDRDRKRLADSLQAAVAGRFTPVVDLEEACA